MKKLIPLYIIVLIGTFALGVWLSLNVPGFRSIFKGGTVYTSSAVDAARKEGYEEGLKDKQSLQEQIDALKTDRDKFSELYKQTLNNYNNLLTEHNSTLEELELSNQQNEQKTKELEQLKKQLSDMQEQLDYYVKKLEEFSQTKYNKVTFIVENGDEEETFALAYVLPNEYAEMKLEPSKAYYIFKGWSINKQDVVELQSYQITQDTKFYAVFETAYGLFDQEGKLTKSWQSLLDENIIQLQPANERNAAWPDGQGNVFENCNGNQYILQTALKQNHLVDTNVTNAMVGKLVIPNDIVCIDSYAFRGCKNLTDVVLPSSIIALFTSCFASCNLNSITIDKNIACIKGYVFDRATVNKTLFNGTVDDWAKIKRPDFYYSAEINKNLYIDGENLTEIEINAERIEPAAFCGIKTLTSVTINNSITKIGNGAFCSCSNLKSVALNEDLESIGDSAFSNCSQLSSIEIGANISSIGANAFAGCSGLTSYNYKGTLDKWCEIEFGDEKANIASILGKVIINNQEITDIQLTSTRKINAYAFYKCKNLNLINLENVTEIGKDAFYESSFKSINWGKTLNKIGEYAFAYSDFSSLSNALILPDSISILERACFVECNINRVVFGQNLSYIGKGVFVSNPLTSAEFKNVKYFGISDGHGITTSIYVDNVEKNAEYLIDTYSNCEWQSRN